jgi:hypothetical protein
MCSLARHFQAGHWLSHCQKGMARHDLNLSEKGQPGRLRASWSCEVGKSLEEVKPMHGSEPWSGASKTYHCHQGLSAQCSCGDSSSDGGVTSNQDCLSLGPTLYPVFSSWGCTLQRAHHNHYLITSQIRVLCPVIWTIMEITELFTLDPTGRTGTQKMALICSVSP